MSGTSTIQVEVNQVGAATSQGIARHHHVPIDRPQAKGGDDAGAMGGELLLIALGGCFLSNLLAAIRAREAQVSNVRIRVAGTLESAPPRYSAVEMHISADYQDRELLEKLVTISERACIVANTLKAAMPLAILID